MIGSLFACKKNNIDEDPESKTDTIFAPGFNLTDSKAVFFIPNSYGCDNFYKVTKDNGVEIVGFINTDGVNVYENPTDDIYIGLNWCLNGRDFLLVQGDIKTWNTGSNSIQKSIFAFINKETGEILEIDETYVALYTGANTFLNNFDIQSSSDNNFYYHSYNKVYKVNFSLNYEQYSPVGKEIRHFKVKNNGCMMYKDIVSEYVIKSPSGSLFSVSDNVSGDIDAFWLGTNNNFYIYRNNESIDKIEIVGNDMVITNVYNNFSSLRNLNNEYYFKQEVGDAVFFFPINLNGNIIWSYDESANEATDVTAYFPDYVHVVDVDSSNDYFYLATKDNIYKYSSNIEGITLFDQSDYDIYTMCVDENDNVIFNALRNSDGKVIIGFVDSEGNINILDDTLNSQVEYLEFL